MLLLSCCSLCFPLESDVAPSDLPILLEGKRKDEAAVCRQGAAAFVRLTGLKLCILKQRRGREGSLL